MQTKQKKNVVSRYSFPRKKRWFVSRKPSASRLNQPFWALMPKLRVIFEYWVGYRRIVNGLLVSLDKLVIEDTFSSLRIWSVSQSVSQSARQPVSPSVRQSVSPSVRQSVSQSVSRSVSQSVSHSVNQPASHSATWQQSALATIVSRSKDKSTCRHFKFCELCSD